MEMEGPQRSQIGHRVYGARKAARLSQDELADASGVSRRTIGNIETGRTVPQRDVLDRLSAVLDLSTPFEETNPQWLDDHIETISSLLLTLPAKQRDKLMTAYVVSLSRALRDQTLGRSVARGLLE